MTNPRDDLMALAPCPFCHGAAYLHEHEGQRPEDTRYSVHCDECDATHDTPSKDAAVAAWNRRTVASHPAPVEAKWRPIETAPKEDPERPGRDFEIIVGGGEIKDESSDLAPWRPFDSWSLACYDSMRGCWRGEQTEQYGCFYLHKPTHWMPKFAGPGQCGSTTPDAVSEPVEAEGGGEPVAWPPKQQLMEAIHYGLGGNGWAYSNYGDDELIHCRDKLAAAAEAVQALYTHPPKSSDTSAKEMRDACELIATTEKNQEIRAINDDVGPTAKAMHAAKAFTASKIAAAIRQLPTAERGDK